MMGMRSLFIIAVLFGFVSNSISLLLKETSGQPKQEPEQGGISKRVVISSGSLADLLPDKLNEICGVCARQTGNDKKTVCPSNYQLNPHSNTCIRLVKSRKTWVKANNYCSSHGERLATFETLESAFWLINLRKANKDWKVGPVWVGGKFINGAWRWQGKSTAVIDTLPWGTDQPEYSKSEECLNSWKEDQYTFHDRKCDSIDFFICEKLK